MPTHQRFEELSALATSGEISRADAEVLSEHVIQCGECQSFMDDSHKIVDSLVPLSETALDLEQPPVGIRERFLSRAKAEGLHIEAGPAFPPPAAPEPRVAIRASREEKVRPLTTYFSHWPNWLLFSAACAACFLVGVLVQPRIEGKWQAIFGKPTSQTAAVVTPSSPLIQSGEPSRKQLVVLTTQRDELTARIAALSAELESLKKQKQDSENTLTQKLASIQSTGAQQAETLTTRITDLETQLNAARQQQSLLEASLHSERVKVTEYSARLELAQKALQPNPNASTASLATAPPVTSPLPSDSAVGSLVAARNLHIIDVYDSNSAGARQRAFGRVFYVEGRSLVFYAFDLSAPHQAKNITFHLWGEKAGQKETTLSLGILHDDDPAERRWALTFDDPKVLAKINSVYVTAESKPSDQPRGPKVLYAYFGSQPNHP